METGSKPPDFRRLKRLMFLALILGGIVLIGSGWVLGVFRRPEIATGAITVAFGSITSSAVFYFGALLTEGSLQQYIDGDETEIRGESVELVTHTHTSGDPRIDGWVRAYVFARNLFGMSLIPLLILGGLYFFG